VESSALKLIRGAIYAKKNDLLTNFKSIDVQNTGKVSTDDWSKILKTTLKIDIPWQTMQQKIADLEADGRIDYSKFISRYQLSVDKEVMNALNQTTRKLCLKIYRTGNELKQAFKTHDKTGSGVLPKAEFEAILKKLNFTSEDRKYLLDTVDVDANGNVNAITFIDGFKPVLKTSQSDPAINDMLLKIGTVLLSKVSSSEAILKFDKNKSGHISRTEFSQALKELGFTFSDEETKKLMDYVDEDKSGHISYKEFIKAFRIEDPNSDLKQKSLHRLCEILYLYRFQLKRLFRSLDLDNSGTIDNDEFLAGFLTLQSLLAKVEGDINSTQSKELFKILDADHNKKLNYREFKNFVDAFAIIDTNSPL